MSAVPDPTVEALPECACPSPWRERANYGPDPFAPAHVHQCPRNIPNRESFCVMCGTAVNYAPHRPWCILAARAAAPDALRVRIEALAAEWESRDYWHGEALSWARAGAALRALLDDPAPAGRDD